MQESVVDQQLCKKGLGERHRGGNEPSQKENDKVRGVGTQKPKRSPVLTEDGAIQEYRRENSILAGELK